MARPHGSVRMGPISLFVLVITLCLAVLAVLAVTTAQAQAALAQQQAVMVEDTYRNEAEAQRFVADLDGLLLSCREAGTSFSEALADVEDYLTRFNDQYGNEGGGAEATLEGSEVVALFAQPSGRLLTVRLGMNENLTYSVLGWQATTLWVEPGTDNILWEGKV